jgi:type II secretory pathway pseudopilin PulG
MVSLKLRGLSVLEMMLALGILAAAVLGLVLLFGSGLQLQRQSADVTRATEVGRTFLETLRSQGGKAMPTAHARFDGRINQVSDPSTGFPPAPYPSLDVDGRTYRLVVELAVHSASRKSVKVEVYWDQNSRVVLETSYFQ